jgi:hypothetical protein
VCGVLRWVPHEADFLEESLAGDGLPADDAERVHVGLARVGLPHHHLRREPHCTTRTTHTTQHDTHDGEHDTRSPGSDERAPRKGAKRADVRGQSTFRPSAADEELIDTPKSHTLATRSASRDVLTSKMLGVLRSRCMTGGVVPCRKAQPLATSFRILSRSVQSSLIAPRHVACLVSGRTRHTTHDTRGRAEVLCGGVEEGEEVPAGDQLFDDAARLHAEGPQRHDVGMAQAAEETRKKNKRKRSRNGCA